MNRFRYFEMINYLRWIWHHNNNQLWQRIRVFSCALPKWTIRHHTQHTIWINGADPNLKKTVAVNIHISNLNQVSILIGFIVILANFVLIILQTPSHCKSTRAIANELAWRQKKYLERRRRRKKTRLFIWFGVFGQFENHLHFLWVLIAVWQR